MDLVAKLLAIYVRTSTEKQDTGLEAQLMACRDYCARNGIGNFVIYSDDDESGGKEHRPELDRMMADIEAGKIDRVLVYCLSRLSRSVAHSYMLAADFRSKGVKLLSCTETIEFDTPEGRLLFGILAVINQYQKEDTVRKVVNGLENARRKGVRLGRPQSRDDAAILACFDRTQSQAAVARELGVSRGAIQRALAARGAK
jgi:site-specific DNA recombinase